MLPECQINLTAETLTPGGWLCLFNLAMGAVNSLIILAVTFPKLLSCLKGAWEALLLGSYSGIPRVLLFIVGACLIGQGIQSHLLYLTPDLYMTPGAQIAVGASCIFCTIVWTCGLNPEAFRN